MAELLFQQLTHKKLKDIPSVELFSLEKYFEA
jgi:hypothetical protein